MSYEIPRGSAPGTIPSLDQTVANTFETLRELSDYYSWVPDEIISSVVEALRERLSLLHNFPLLLITEAYSPETEEDQISSFAAQLIDIETNDKKLMVELILEEKPSCRIISVNASDVAVVTPIDLYDTNFATSDEAIAKLNWLTYFRSFLSKDATSLSVFANDFNDSLRGLNYPVGIIAQKLSDESRIYSLPHDTSNPSCVEELCVTENTMVSGTLAGIRMFRSITDSDDLGLFAQVEIGRQRFFVPLSQQGTFALGRRGIDNFKFTPKSP